MPQTRTFLPLPADIAGSAELRPLVERANGWLADQLAEWPNPVTVAWYAIANAVPGQPMVGLRVTDKYSTVEGVFRSSQLHQHREFQYDLIPVLNKLIRQALEEFRRRDELEQATEAEAGVVMGGAA